MTTNDKCTYKCIYGMLLVQSGKGHHIFQAAWYCELASLGTLVPHYHLDTKTWHSNLLIQRVSVTGCD